MKKCIMMILVCSACLLVAQDIAGTYRATGQRVEYQFYTRPNVPGSTTYDQSGGNADFSTTLSIHDAYGLGVTVPIANIPVGYNFAEIVNGPLGLDYMNALQYFLYVTFDLANLFVGIAYQILYPHFPFVQHHSLALY